MVHGSTPVTGFLQHKHTLYTCWGLFLNCILLQSAVQGMRPVARRLVDPAITHKIQTQGQQLMPDLQQAYTWSNDMGVAHCVFQGQVVPNEVVNLHVWLRLRPVGANLLIRGMAHMMTKDPHGAHVQQAQSATSWNRKLLLKSDCTEAEYPLKVEPRKQDDPFHVSANLTLPDADVAGGDFQLVADGFDFVCAVYSHLPMHTQGFLAALPENPAPSPPVYFLMSPLFKVTAQQVAPVLKKHIKWHQKLGVHQHLLYTFERAEQLLYEPSLQEEYARRALQLVIWQDTAVHLTHGKMTWFDQYLFQEIMYNHALLSLWGHQAYVVVADLDEFVATPQPTTIPQMFATCGGEHAAQLVVGRSSAVCTSCTGQEAEEWSKDDKPLVNYYAPEKLNTTSNNFKSIIRVDEFHELMGTFRIHESVNVKDDTVRVMAACSRIFHLLSLWRRRPSQWIEGELHLIAQQWLWPYQDLP